MAVIKNYTNLEIAETLRSVAAAYKLKDEARNKFRIVAYERAADSIEHATSELKDLWDDGKLNEVPSIGSSLSEHLDELFRTGKSKHFEDVMKGLPPIMFKFMEIPGIGAKTAFRLATELGLKSLTELKKAAEKGMISKLEGFGEKSEAEILTSLKESKNKVRRNLLPYAKTIADEVISYLKLNSDVIEANALGSLRRMASTIGDIDIAVSTKNPKSVIDYFTKFDKTQRIIEKGDRTAAILFPGSIRIDLMAETPDAYGALLQHFTGSKHHNIALREYALKKGLSVSDYGIYIKKENNKLKKFETEKQFYDFLGMDYIPPELREDTGEIKAALRRAQGKPGGLPNLIELTDVKSDFHIHSNFNVETSHDLGESTMAELIEKADLLNYEYIALSEHNPSQQGHSASDITRILKKKRTAVDSLNLKISSEKGRHSLKKIFNSLEIDIKPDGTLPVPLEALDTLDFALVSIHSSFNQSREEMTSRILKALSYPKVKIFAHPTARKLTDREGIEINWPVIFSFCKEKNIWLEINSDSMRLDLPDMVVREAVKNGVKLTFGTDAHHYLHMDNMKWGISVARRGWAERKDIVNTLTLEEFEKMLQFKNKE